MRRANQMPLVVGGTGLYIRSLFDGLFAEPPLDPVRRSLIEAELTTMSVGDLRAWTEALDPGRSHLGRTQLIRSIEIALLTGQRLSDLHRRHARTSHWRPRYLVVDPGPALAHRISARIDDMLDHGWPDEVRGLMETVPADAPAWNATGYDAVRGLVRGERSRAGVHEDVLIATRQYAKRQRTWFRHQLPVDRVTRVDPLSPDWQSTVAEWVNAIGAGTA
jgi:tRNA dimethylallyltransferase